MKFCSYKFKDLYLEPSKNGVYKSSQYMGNGTPIVKMNELFNKSFIGNTLDGLDKIELSSNEKERFLLQNGDLLFSRTSVVADGVGKCSIVQIANDELAFESNLIRVRLDTKKTSPSYIFYFFQSSLGRGKVIAISNGVAVRTIRGSDLGELEISIPDKDLQDRIADIISAYDDLIENNRRRIDLLEQSARMLYKEWFVTLRFPGHEHAKVEDGVPQGWEKKIFSDVCQSIGGGTPSTKKREYWEDGDITWVTPTDVTHNDCLALIDSEKKITESGLRESSARLVPPNTILMTSRASIGFFAMMEKEVCTNQGFISIIPKEPILKMYLLHNLLYRVEEIRSNAGGTTFKEISKSRFRNMSVVIPSNALLDQFEENAYLSLRQTRILQKQIKKLRQARDLLLPRLMNGEIPV